MSRRFRQRGQRVIERLFPGILAIHTAFLRVMHMVRSPFSLMAPSALAHTLLRATQRALGAPSPPPAIRAALRESPTPPAATP